MVHLTSSIGQDGISKDGVSVGVGISVKMGRAQGWIAAHAALLHQTQSPEPEEYPMLPPVSTIAV